MQWSDGQVKVRLHEGAGGTYLWVVNPTRTVKTVKITLPAAYERAVELWQEAGSVSVSGNILTTTVEDRDAAVIRLE